MHGSMNPGGLVKRHRLGEKFVVEAVHDGSHVSQFILAASSSSVCGRQVVFQTCDCLVSARQLLTQCLMHLSRMQ